MKKGAAFGVLDHLCVVACDIYVVAGRRVPDAVVEGLLRAVWEHPEALPRLPGARRVDGRDGARAAAPAVARAVKA